MKTNLFLILLLNLSVAIANDMWISGEAGKSFHKLENDEDKFSGNYFGSKIYYSFGKDFIFDIGAGFSKHKTNLDYNSGKFYTSETSSYNTFIYFSPKKMISEHFSISLENQIMIGPKMKFGMHSEQSVMSGLGINHHSKLSEKINTRVGVALHQGLNLAHNDQLVSLSIHFNYNPPRKEKKIQKITAEETYSDKDSVFPFDDYVISEENHEKIKNLVSILRNSKYEKIIIEGHTDRIGNAKYNKNLGEKRANSFKSKMVELGLDENKILVVPMGEDNLLDKAFTPEAHAKNRRVEIKVFFDPNENQNLELVKINKGLLNE